MFCFSVLGANCGEIRNFLKIPSIFYPFLSDLASTAMQKNSREERLWTMQIDNDPIQLYRSQFPYNRIGWRQRQEKKIRVGALNETCRVG